MWRIPATRMKARSNGDHVVPLVDEAVSILRELEPVSGHGRLVFPGTRSRERPISDATMNAAFRRLDIGADEFVGHGWRHVFSTVANESGEFDPDVIEAALHHVDGSVRGALQPGEAAAGAASADALVGRPARAVQGRRAGSSARERALEGMIEISEREVEVDVRRFLDGLGPGWKEQLPGITTDPSYRAVLRCQRILAAESGVMSLQWSARALPALGVLWSLSCSAPRGDAAAQQARDGLARWRTEHQAELEAVCRAREGSTGRGAQPRCASSLHVRPDSRSVDSDADRGRERPGQGAARDSSC